MPNGGKGAIAKIYVETEVVDNFKQQAAKIKSGLGNSLKDIKDLDLNFGFETESMAKAAGKELNEVMRLATSQKLERLDFSGIFPGLTDYLKDNSIADELKLQVVQGLRKGLEDFSRLSSTKDIENLIRIGDGTDVWSNLLLSNAAKDVIGSFDLKKKDNDIFLKQFKTLTSSNIRKDSGSFIQDLQQLLSLKATADNKEYQDVIKYLVSGRYYDARSKKEQLMFELPAINDALRVNDFYKKGEQDKLTEKDIRNFAGYFGRLQYLTTVSDDEGLHEIYNGIIKNKHFDELFNPKNPKEGLAPDQLAIFREVVDQVIKASQYKDAQYQAMDKQAFKSDVSQAVNALFAASGDNGTMARLSPLIQGWEEKAVSVSADQLLAETIKSLGIRFEDNGLKAGDDSAERAERAAGRAEQAADRAETASETAVQAAEDIRQAIEDGIPQTDDERNDKPQSQEPSTQADDTAEHIADGAEADAENAEHIAKSLEEKKEQLENNLNEFRDKAKGLKEANEKYRKAIEEIYDDIKTPEEALQLLKEKSAQLQQADSEFKGIESKRNSFTNPSNSEEIAIVEEYNQRRANLEQAIIEYNKAGRLAVDRKVNPEDIRQNLVDEELLSFDSRGERVLEQYIDHLKQVIADNEKDIKSWEDLVSQYQSQLDQLNTGQIGQTGQQLDQQQNAIIEEINNINEQIDKFEKTKKELPKQRENAREFIDSLITQRNEINATLKEKTTPNNYQEALDNIKNNIEQLKESEKAFKEIETQFNALDNKDISVKANQIRKGYEKKLADLQRAAYAYNRSKENAMQFDEYNEQDVQRLLNQAGYDSTKGFLGQNIPTQQLHKALKQTMKELKGSIPNYESWYKDSVKYDDIRYQRRIDELIQRRNELTQELSRDNLTPNAGHEEIEQVQKTRKKLQAEREKLLEEIRQSKETQSEAEAWLNKSQEVIQEGTNKQERLTNRITNNASQKNVLEEEASQLTEEITVLTTQIDQIREKRKELTLKLQAFEKETDEITKGEEYNTKLEASGRLSGVETTIKRLNKKSSQINDVKNEFDQLYVSTDYYEGKRPAFQHLKQAAEANKKAQEQYAEWVRNKPKYPSMADFDSVFDWEQAQDEYEQQQEEIRDNLTRANYNYVRAVQNAFQEKVSSSWMEKYLTPEYDINREFTFHNSYYDHPEDWDDDEFVSIGELQNSIEEKNEKLLELQTEIKKQQEEAKHLRDILGDDWENNTFNARTNQAESKQAEIDKLKEQETDLENQRYYKQRNLDEKNSYIDTLNNRIKEDKATQQTNEQYLQRLEEGRKARQEIIRKAKEEQIIKQQQLKELDQLIAEAEARESVPPIAPTISEDNGGNNAVPLSEQSGEESPTVQNTNQQLENLKNEEQQLKDKLAQIIDEKGNIEKIIEEIESVLNKNFSVKTAKEAYNNAKWESLNVSTLAVERFEDRAPEDKNSDKWKQWFERNKQRIQEEKLAWFKYNQAMEEFEAHGSNTVSKMANRRRLRTSDSVTSTREDWGFTTPEDLKQQLEADLQAKKELLASYKQQEEELNSQITNVQQKKEQVKTQSPLSSSGTQTANGVQEEGAEAGDAADKMKALADAKKEALEVNRQLAESADTTTNAIRNESNAGSFDELISKLVEAAKLLGQLPQSFEGFKGFDLEPLNNLSQAIQQFPKEGFNISLGDSFDNLANNIDKTLQKVQELTSQAKNAEIESTIAEKYDEQIKQLKADVEEAKRVIEELKKTKQDIQKTTPITQSKKQETPIPVPVEPYFEDKIIGTNYKFLKETQQKLFDAKTVQDFQAALQDVESVLQRIQALENEAVQKHATSMDVLYMAHNGSMPSEYENKMPELAKGRLESSANLKSLTDNFVSEQQKMIDVLQSKLNSIEIIPEEVQVNWGDQQREQYNRMAEGVKFAQASVKELGNVLSELQSKGFDAEQMKWFLELKEATTGSVDNLENQNNAFNNSVSTKSENYLSKLSGAEKRLQKIKNDSEKLIYIDPSLNDVLQQTEQHLKEIRKIKNTINKDPLQVLNPQFTNDTESYISQLYGTDDKQGVLNGFEQVSDRSQTDFDRIVSNYSRYTTALNKLFTDLAKGSAISADQLTKDLTRINDLASRLANGTGLNKNDLLTGELDSKADSTIVDAQTEATNKFAIAYEAMLTKIETNAESAKNQIEKIFGTEGITQGLDNNFIEGNAEGFNDFVQKANQVKKSLQDLEDIQDNIKNDKTWLLQEDNLKKYQQTMSVLTGSLRQVSEKSSDFKIADKLDVQKLRASTAQFIKDNPALSGADIAELQGYISQLQDKINNIDFKNIEDGIRKVKQDATEAGRTGDTFFSMLTQRFKSLGTYLLSFASFYEVINVFKQGINIVHELDDALTEMQKVSDESLASLREYQKTTFATANDIGTTASQLQQSTADWLRLGEDLQQASQSAQTANVLFNVSEFNSIDEATTALVAMSAAYADAEEGIEKIDIVDRLNLIGNNYAIATDELATALQDGAATLQTAGNDLDEAIALTTAGNLITQDASKTGK